MSINLGIKILDERRQIHSQQGSGRLDPAGIAYRPADVVLQFLVMLIARLVVPSKPRVILLAGVAFILGPMEVADKWFLVGLATLRGSPLDEFAQQGWFSARENSTASRILR